MERERCSRQAEHLSVPKIVERWQEQGHALQACSGDEEYSLKRMSAALHQDKQCLHQGALGAVAP